MQSTLQSHPGHNQPSSSGGTKGEMKTCNQESINDQRSNSGTIIQLSAIKKVDRALLSSLNNGGIKQN
jgi:hypothetical protein